VPLLLAFVTNGDVRAIFLVMPQFLTSKALYLLWIFFFFFSIIPFFSLAKVSLSRNSRVLGFAGN
jgi:hypothetical protein